MYLQHGVFKPATHAEQRKHEKMIFDVHTKMAEELQKAIEMLESLKGISIKSLLQKSAIQQEFNNVSDALSFLHVAFEKDSVNSDILQRLISIYIEIENYCVFWCETVENLTNL